MAKPTPLLTQQFGRITFTSHDLSKLSSHLWPSKALGLYGRNAHLSNDVLNWTGDVCLDQTKIKTRGRDRTSPSPWLPWHCWTPSPLSSSAWKRSCSCCHCCPPCLGCCWILGMRIGWLFSSWSHVPAWNPSAGLGQQGRAANPSL